MSPGAASNIFSSSKSLCLVVLATFRSLINTHQKSKAIHISLLVLALIAHLLIKPQDYVLFKNRRRETAELSCCFLQSNCQFRTIFLCSALWAFSCLTVSVSVARNCYSLVSRSQQKNPQYCDHFRVGLWMLPMCLCFFLCFLISIWVLVKCRKDILS